MKYSQNFDEQNFDELRVGFKGDKVVGRKSFDKSLNLSKFSTILIGRTLH